MKPPTGGAPADTEGSSCGTVLIVTLTYLSQLLGSRPAAKEFLRNADISKEWSGRVVCIATWQIQAPLGSRLGRILGSDFTKEISGS
jgi:hypothetical protein